jgi:hypothetical protein
MTNSENLCKQIANVLKEIDKSKWSKEVQHMVLELKTLLWTATDVCWDIAAIENKNAEYCGYCSHRIGKTKYRSEITGGIYCSQECLQSVELNDQIINEV